MARLQWDDLHMSTDHRFSIHSSNVRHEGKCYWVESKYLRSGLLDLDAALRERVREVETAFYGRGALQKAKAAAQQIADLVDGDTTEGAT